MITGYLSTCTLCGLERVAHVASLASGTMTVVLADGVVHESDGVGDPDVNCHGVLVDGCACRDRLFVAVDVVSLFEAITEFVIDDDDADYATARLDVDLTDEI